MSESLAIHAIKVSISPLRADAVNSSQQDHPFMRFFSGNAAFPF